MARCGAKTRSGTPCQRHALRGSKRCRLHGGVASQTNKGNRHAATPGSLYSQFLSESENQAWAGIELGKVDDELRLTRIRLMRALARENEHGSRPELDQELDEPVSVYGVPTNDRKVTRTLKVRDYTALIDKLTARIESLERTRVDLMKANPPEPAPVAKIEIEVVGSARTNPAHSDDGAAG